MMKPTSGNPHKCPSWTINIDDDVLGASQSGSFGTCILAQGCIMKKGVQSTHVTSEFIKFNAPGIDPVDGCEKLMRYCYPTPIVAAAVAEKFDDDGVEHGDAYARQQFKKLYPKGFKFILQGERASKRPVERRPKSKRTATRHHTPPEILAQVCRRRYHGRRSLQLVVTTHHA